MILKTPLARRPIWAQVYWPGCVLHSFTSITDAQKILRQHGKRWVHLPVTSTGRAGLIADGVRSVKPTPIAFCEEPKPYSGFCLFDNNTLLLCQQPADPFPLGEHVFIEDKLGAPSRAYLKLWEVFTVHAPELASQLRDKTVLDLGASPGGWTYVLAGLGARVIAVDKAPLAVHVLHMPGVEALEESAFGLKPQNGHFALFSDIICYPDRLLQLIEAWHQTDCKVFVCTIKFQKDVDYEELKQFYALPNARIIHLHQNKHEVTFLQSL